MVCDDHTTNLPNRPAGTADRSPSHVICNKNHMEENLQFVPPDVLAAELTEDDRELIVGGLEDAVSPVHLEAMWQIIWQRWRYWQQLRGGGE